MYIVAIGWAYVILMMAITASSIGKALAILIFLGVCRLPCLCILPTDPAGAGAQCPFADEISGQSNAADSQSDQN